jgi:hypothetical protein
VYPVATLSLLLYVPAVPDNDDKRCSAIRLIDSCAPVMRWRASLVLLVHQCLPHCPWDFRRTWVPPVELEPLAPSWMGGTGSPSRQMFTTGWPHQVV